MAWKMKYDDRVTIELLLTASPSRYVDCHKH